MENLFKMIKLSGIEEKMGIPESKFIYESETENNQKQNINFCLEMLKDLKKVFI